MGADTALGRANVAIRATLEKLDSDLAGARAKVDGAVKKIADGALSGLQTIGTGVLAGIGAATGAVVGLGAALGKIAIDAAPVEGLASSFEGLAASAGYGADEMLSALQRGSAGMISQRDLMMSFNKAASLVSTDFAVQLPEAMGYLSKVAASTGQDVGFLMDSLVTGVGRLSPMILDNLSIQVSQAEATERAAQMYGKEAAALSKTELQAGMMSVTMEKLAANTAAMPDVSESAAAKLAQLTAGFQDAKDQIGMAFLPVLTRLIDAALPVFQKLIERIVPGVEKLSGVLSALADYFSFVAEEGDWLNDSLVDLPETLRPIVMAIGQFVAGLRAAFNGDLLTSFTQIEEVAYRLGQIIRDVLSGNFAILFTTFEDGSSRLGALFQALGMGEQAAQSLAATINNLVTTVTSWLAENVKLQDVLIALGVAVATVVLPVLGGIIGAVAPVIGIFLLVTAVVAALRAAWENDFLGIRTALTEAWEGKIKPALSELWDWLKVNVPLALEALRAFWVDQAWPAIQRIVEAVWPVIQGIFQALGAFISGTVIPTVQSLYNTWVTVVWPAIQTAIETAWPVIQTIFQTIVTWVTGTLIPTLQSLYDKWVTEVWPTIQTVTENVWTVVSGIFEELGRWINDNIMPWIEALRAAWVDTIWPAIQTALETAWGVIEPIWEALRAWLEETLPPAIEGLRTAFETVMAAIETAIKPVKTLWDEFKSAVEGFWTWITSHDFSFNIKIPDLPDWAIPGSPLPIHTAWANFADEMNRMTLSPSVDLGSMNELMPRPSEDERAQTGTGPITIYGLTLEGVQDSQGLLAELQALS